MKRKGMNPISFISFKKQRNLILLLNGNSSSFEIFSFFAFIFKLLKETTAKNTCVLQCGTENIKPFLYSLIGASICLLIFYKFIRIKATMSDDDLDNLDELLEEALDDLKEKEAKNEEKAKKKDEELNAAVNMASSMNLGDDCNLDGYVNILSKLLSTVEDGEIEDQDKETIAQLKGVVQMMEKGDMDDACTLLEKMKKDDTLLKEENPFKMPNEAAMLSLLSNISTNEQTCEKNFSMADTSSSSKTEGVDSSTVSPSQLGSTNAESELLKTIIETSLSPEVLDLFEKMTEGFPRWLEAKKDQLSEKELELRQKQYEKTLELCNLMKEGSINEKVIQIIDLFNELSELGELPQELSDYATPFQSSEENKAQ